MAYTTSDASVLMKDYIEPVVRESFQEEDNTFKVFMEGDKERTNIRGRRISYKVRPNPSYGSTTEGALLPAAGQLRDIEGRVYYLNQFLVGEMNKEVLDQDDDMVIVGLLRRNQQADTQTFRQRQNLWMFGNSNGSLGVISDASGGTTVVFAAPYGAENFIDGSVVWFYDSSNTRRVGGGAVDSTISSHTVSPGSTGTVVFDQVPSDLAATDYAVYKSSQGLAPHGLEYQVDNTLGANAFLGINTSTYPTITSTVHDAQNKGLVPGMIDLVQAKARNKTGVNEPVNNRVILSHTTQEFNYRQLGYDLFRNVAATGNDKIDLGFPAAAHNGMRWKLDLNCARSTLYGLKFSDFTIEFIRLPGFYTLANGDKLWQKPAAGGVYDAIQYSIHARYDLVCKDRRSQWKITNLPYVVGI